MGAVPIRLLKHRWSPLARAAWRNRQELIAGRLTSRRDLLKLGLLTGAGALLAKHGLSSRVASATEMASPPTRAFFEPLPLAPIKRPLANGAEGLVPYPTVWPNNAGGEGRTRPHQAFGRYPALFPFPPRVVFDVRECEAPHYFCADLPRQRLWGFDGMVPGPTYHAREGEQILVRVRNELPKDNGGFGLQQTATHLHNHHSPSESDGFPGDFFPDPHRSAIAKASFYDYHYPNALAGFGSTHPPYGDPNEALSTLWYHDHRVEFTAQNVYKGLAGFYLRFNRRDTGDETTGFRLPGVREGDFYAPVRYDIPLVLQERVFDPATGQVFFDLFEKDGILGDKFLVNGRIQPYLEVEPRRYRFRILAGGPARFHELFLTDLGPNSAIPLWQIANDGNLLPRALKVPSLFLSIGERPEVVVDFARWAGKTLYLEDRLIQDDGRGPERNVGEKDRLHRPGQGRLFLQLRVGTRVTVPDRSVDFEAVPEVRFYDLPAREAPRIERTFSFDRTKGQWAVNGKLFPADSGVVHFRVRRDSAEHWNINNNSGGWMHPFHVHLEEFQFVRRSGRAVGAGSPDYSRNDVFAMQHNELNTIFMRFRDFEGRYTLHCHQPTHEDHAMMLRFDVDETGDTKQRP